MNFHLWYFLSEYSGEQLFPKQNLPYLLALSFPGTLDQAVWQFWIHLQGTRRWENCCRRCFLFLFFLQSHEVGNYISVDIMGELTCWACKMNCPPELFLAHSIQHQHWCYTRWLGSQEPEKKIIFFLYIVSSASSLWQNSPIEYI